MNNYVDSLNSNNPERSDEEFNRNDNIKKHEQSYTAILDAYAKALKTSLDKKGEYKSRIFWLSFALLCLFPIAIFILFVLYFHKFDDVLEWCAVIVPAFLSFLTIYIAIPKIITKYLFNSEEEKYMSDIIKNIQDYDKK